MPRTPHSRVSQTPESDPYRPQLLWGTNSPRGKDWGAGHQKTPSSRPTTQGELWWWKWSPKAASRLVSADNRTRTAKALQPLRRVSPREENNENYNITLTDFQNVKILKTQNNTRRTPCEMDAEGLRKLWEAGVELREQTACPECSRPWGPFLITGKPNQACWLEAVVLALRNGG